MLRRVWQAFVTWAGRFADDVKASTDASLLSGLRFLGLLYGPIDTRLPIDEALRQALGYRLPRHAGWRHAWGGLTYFLFIVLVLSGVLLSFYYRPSAEEAYQSVQHIISGVSFGWLVRDVHVWGANLVVLTALAHMGRVFFDAAYKPPRETNWLIGVLLLFLVFAFGATGYLLPWDQWAYWMVSEGLGALSHVPVIGGVSVQVLRGDPVVSGATLSRFFALHVIVLPWFALGLLILHFSLVRKHGIAGPEAAAAGGGVRFFPNHLLRSVSVAVLAMAVVVTGAVLAPRAVGAPASPGHPPGTLVSSWVVADVSRALVFYLGAWGFAAFLVLGLALALLPLFDRSPERRLRRRPAVVVLGVVFFVGFAAAWLAGRQLRSVPPHLTEPTAVFVPPPAAALPLPVPGPAPAQPAPPRDTTRRGRPR